MIWNTVDIKPKDNSWILIQSSLKKIQNIKFNNCIMSKKDISKVIFTTQDGYDITEGMKYYSVKIREYEIHPELKKLKGWKESPVWSMCGPYINPMAHKPTGDIVYFYKKENAIEFINQNKEDE